MNEEIENLINITIAEDIRSGDITSFACVSEHSVTSGKFLLKQAGVIAGLPFIEILFKKIDPRIEITPLVDEGSFHKSGTYIAKITGPARGILTAERIVLNLLQHASGVASITNAYVRKVAGLECAILDTRKTLPGLRALEKYAVVAGGGKNHRHGLDDRFIIKTNHLAFISPRASNPITQAVEKAYAYNPKLPIEIEIADINDLDEALKTRAASIMLIGMLPEEAKVCIKKGKTSNKKIYIESGGTITLDTVRAYAETGVNGISVGELTHSVHALDIRMRLT